MAQFACVCGIPADRLRVPENDAITASDETDTVTRRIIALVVDLAFVLLPSLILALILTERFTILGALSNGRPLFDPADQTRINEIDEGFNRAIRLGDTVHTLSGTGLILTVAALVFLSGVVFFIVPAVARGLTPGRLLLGFPDRDLDEAGAEVIDVSWSEGSPDIAEPDAEMVKHDRTNQAVTATPAPEPRPQSKSQLQPQPQPQRREIKLDAPDGQSPGAHTDPASEHKQPEALPAQATTASLNNLDELFDYEQQDWKAAPQVTLGDDEDYAIWDDVELESAARKPADARQNSDLFERLRLPESSLAESSLVTTRTPHTAIEVIAIDDVADDVDEETVAEADGPSTTPEWSEDWQAWVYQDEATDRWFRHDTTEDRWLPIG